MVNKALVSDPTVRQPDSNYPAGHGHCWTASVRTQGSFSWGIKMPDLFRQVPIWRTAAILKIVCWFIVRLTRNLVRISKITLRHRSRDQSNKFRNFKMADRRPPFWKWFYRYVSRGSSDLDEIWCSDGIKNGNLIKKVKNLQIPNGWWLSYWKSAYISHLLFDKREIWYEKAESRSDSG